MEQINELVLVIARSLVDEPDQVTVNMMEGESALVFELSVAKRDLGQVIGKQGRTANAFRTILAAAGAKVKRRCTLEIIE